MSKALDNLGATRCQREVWKLVAEGLTNKEIADALGKSVKTVEKQRFDAMHIVKARNAADMTREAIRYGVISMEVLP